MPSIEQIMDVAEPVIQEKVSAAVLETRKHVLAEVKRFAQRAPSVEAVIGWCELNERLIAAVEDQGCEAA